LGVMGEDRAIWIYAALRSASLAWS
jgi:hypothetical protein